MPSIAAESFIRVTQMLAIFSEMFSKVRQFISTEKRFCDSLSQLLSISSLFKIGIYKQIGVIVPTKSNKNHRPDIFHAKFLAKNTANGWYTAAYKPWVYTIS